MLPRPVALALSGLLVLTACAADPARGPAAPEQAPTGEKAPCIASRDLPGGDVEAAPRDDVALFPWEVPADEVTAHAGFDPAAIRPAGPPPDGIRPIEFDDACFDTIADGDRFLTANAPVMVVEVADDVRAYPLGIMTQHEIVNDVIGGVPVVVTYCPLCNSGLAFERTVDGEVLDFGTSGRLFQSNLVMYDRQHRNLWSQLNGTAVVGRVQDDVTGTVLERLPTSLLGWAEFKRVAPDGIVLSPDVGPSRDYNRNPYPNYDATGVDFGLFSGPRDDALPPNTRVVGVGVDLDPVAVPLQVLMERRVVEVEIDGSSISVWWAPGASSALDKATVDAGQDVGQTLSVIPVLPDGRELDFEASEDDPSTFVDRQTGSAWNLLGEAVAGELAGTRLVVVPRDDTFWFVWFAFQPDTRVAGGA